MQWDGLYAIDAFATPKGHISGQFSLFLEEGLTLTSLVWVGITVLCKLGRADIKGVNGRSLAPIQCEQGSPVWGVMSLFGESSSMIAQPKSIAAVEQLDCVAIRDGNAQDAVSVGKCFPSQKGAGLRGQKSRSLVPDWSVSCK